MGAEHRGGATQSEHPGDDQRAQRRRASAERATRRYEIGAGIGDVGQLQPASEVTQHPQRIRLHLAVEMQWLDRERHLGVPCIGEKIGDLLLDLTDVIGRSA